MISAHEHSQRHAGDQPEVVIKRGTGWRSLNIKEIWLYRELLWVLVTRDIKVRYKQTVLGASWALIQPLATMLLLSLIFGRLVQVPSDGFPYPIFLFAGLLPWSLFAGSISKTSGSIIGQHQLISKVYFPRLILPLSSIGSGLLDFVISFFILLALMLYFDFGWSTSLLALPFIVLAIVFVALGVGTLLSALVVSYRDFNYVIPFLIQIWMYATPIIYPASLIPHNLRWLLFLNPMAGIIDAFRSAVLGRDFDLAALTISLVSGVLIFVIGILYFNKMERRFADII